MYDYFLESSPTPSTQKMYLMPRINIFLSAMLNTEKAHQVAIYIYIYS